MYSYLQILMPKRFLTTLAGWLAKHRLGPITRWAIRSFISHYQVNMQEAAQQDPNAYKTFNAFFTRKLAQSARNINQGDQVVVSPVDAAVAAIGEVRHGVLFQAKGKYYSLASLLADDHDLAEYFYDGLYLTAYLSPRDYHRVHMPYAGRLVKMTYVPGKLYSVNNQSAAAINNIFARNERVIFEFESDLGPFVMIMVGATIVGSVVTPWHGAVTYKPRQEHTWSYQKEPIDLAKGDELGCFQLGSTVILLFKHDSLHWNSAVGQQSVLLLGQDLAYFNKP